MRLFRKRKKVEKKEEIITASIKNVSRYDEVINFMSDWSKSEWKISKNQLLHDVYDDILVEVAMDKLRTNMLFPSSINVNANFQDFENITKLS